MVPISNICVSFTYESPVVDFPEWRESGEGNGDGLCFFNLVVWCVCFSNLSVIFLNISIADFPGCRESGEGDSGEIRSFNLAAWSASLLSSLAISWSFFTSFLKSEVLLCFFLTTSSSQVLRTCLGVRIFRPELEILEAFFFNMFFFTEKTTFLALLFSMIWKIGIQV